MRILFVINSFSYGGAEKLVMDLSQVLIEQCPYIAIAALYTVGDDTERRLVEQLHQKNIQTYLLGKRAGKDRAAAVGKIMEIVRRDCPDVIHCHCSVPMLLGKIAGKLTATAVVGTVHNTRGYSMVRETLTGWMCSRYVSIGDAVQRYMTDSLKISPGKIVGIYNAVDTIRYAPGEKTEGFWERYGLKGDLPTLLNVGRVVPQKNQMCLLQALARCREQGVLLQCAIVGNYEETSPTYGDLKAFVQEHDMGDYVKFLGMREEVPQFLRNADAFVMTSVYEGFSVSVLEALLCETPIVVSQMPFVEELEQIGRCATVFPQNDYHALSDILCTGSFCRPDPAACMEIRRRFSMDTFAQNHLRLYQQVAADRERK